MIGATTAAGTARQLSCSRFVDQARRFIPPREASVPFIRPSIRLLAALALAVPVVACEVVEGRQNVGEYFDDSSISNEIRGKFINDPVVHFGDIGVTTQNGVVHLSGRVNTRAEADRAGQLARSVRGVRAVENGILVR